MSNTIGYNIEGFANSSVTSSQTTPIIATELSDPVSLYLPFDSDLNDDSNSNHTVTAYGNAAISATQAKFGGYSAYFDGDGDYLQIADADNLSFGSGDFTIEAFVYFTGSPGSGTSAYTIARKFSYTGSNNQQEYLFRIGASNALEFIYSSNGTSTSGTLTSSINLTASTWHHVVATRYGSVIQLFIDGKSAGTASFSSAFHSGTDPLTIGGRADNQTMFTGYIDDLRITKGVARYTEGFIPPSQAVGATLIGSNETNTTTDFTALYLPFTADLNDDSSHSHTLTAVGSVAISSAQSKYGSNSAVFDGNGDGLTIPSSTAFNFGSGDFTVEAWVYLNNTSQVHHIASWRSDSGAESTNWHLDVPGSNITFHASNGSSYIVSSSTMSMAAKTGWQHVAVTRSGDTFMMFSDGLLMATTTASGTVASTTRNFNIGLDPAGDSNCLNGYINDLRILTGYAKYTADFAPPTSAVGTSVSETVNDLTVLYLPFDDSSMEDQARNHAITKNGSTSSRINTSVKKFGTSSARFEDAERCIEISGGQFDFGSKDFTIEGWFYDDGSGGSRNVALDYRLSGGGAAGAGNETFGFFFYLNEGGNGKFFIGLEDGSGNSAADLGLWPMFSSSSLAISTNTWTHYAITREGSTFRAFKDGSLIATQTGVSAPNASSNGGAILRIGSGHDSSGSVGMAGYIDDLRIINGTALYTAAFTPPTSAVGLAVESGGVTTTTVDQKFLSSVWDSEDVSEKMTDGTWIRNDVTSGANPAGVVVQGAGLEDTNHRWYVEPGVNYAEDISYLIVGGGGGGGANIGGGGGAGGYRVFGPEPFSPGTYPVVVGSGASGMQGNATPASSPRALRAGGQPLGGGNSSFNGKVATGGGTAGGNWDGNPDGGAGAHGGSGGGAGGNGSPSAPPANRSYGDGNTPPVSPPQGMNGGQYYPGPGDGQAGGGGGAGQVGAGGRGPGASPIPEGPGDGGYGLSWPVTAKTYAGGGGGGHGEPTPWGQPVGGLGGGGKGLTGNFQTASDADATYYGGGGGGDYNSGGGSPGGGDGFPGVVKIAYPSSSQAPNISGGTVQVNANTGYVIHVFTSSGDLVIS